MSTLQGHRTTDLESQTGGLVDTAAGSDTEMGETGGNGREGGSVFPLARIKKIMKADKDVSLCSAEAVHLVSLAAVPVCLQCGLVLTGGALCAHCRKCLLTCW